MKQCPQCSVRFRDGVERCPIDHAVLVSLPDPLLGRVIQDRYVVEELIGVGGMGSVYRGRHRVLGRAVALKFLASKLARDPAGRARFIREARAVNRVQHEHLIDVSDVGETDDGMAYMVMELLDGRTLSDAIGEDGMSVGRACRIALQLALALARAHELGVVHRDVKPSNVFLLDKNGATDFVKLLDFGLARVHDDIGLTKSNALFGTPEYIAPEQAMGGGVGPKSDLYALGCVLFEMLTGRLPFEGAPAGLLYKHVYEQPPKLRTLRSELPAELEAAVHRLLQKDPERRHASGYALADELTRIEAQLPDRRSAPSLTAVGVSVAAETSETSVQHEEDRWSDNLASLRARLLSMEARPPEALNAVEQLASWVEEVQRLRKEQRTLDAAKQERNVASRTTQLRLGHAIDALALDEARLQMNADAQANRLREQSEALDRAVRRLLAAVRTNEDAERGQGRPLETAQMTTVMRDWANAQEAYFAAQTALADNESARADLRFQISHLKGRLAGHEEATPPEASVRDDELEAQISGKLFAIRLETARVTQELSLRPAGTHSS